MYLLKLSSSLTMPSEAMQNPLAKRQKSTLVNDKKLNFTSLVLREELVLG